MMPPPERQKSVTICPLVLTQTDRQNW